MKTTSHNRRRAFLFGVLVLGLIFFAPQKQASASVVLSQPDTTTISTQGSWTVCQSWTAWDTTSTLAAAEMIVLVQSTSTPHTLSIAYSTSTASPCNSPTGLTSPPGQVGTKAVLIQNTTSTIVKYRVDFPSFVFQNGFLPYLRIDGAGPGVSMRAIGSAADTDPNSLCRNFSTAGPGNDACTGISDSNFLLSEGVTISNFDMFSPTSTSTRDFVSYGVNWIGDSFTGRLRFTLVDLSNLIEYEAQDVLQSFGERDASSSPTFVFKNVDLEIGNTYRVVASLSELRGDTYYELANASATFAISQEGLTLPTGDVTESFTGSGEAGTILGALKTRIPFVYMFDLFRILQRLGAVEAEAWSGLTLNFGTIAGVALSQEFFSEAQMRTYLPAIFFTLIRSLVIAGWWLGFLAYAWKRVSHPTVESK